MPSTQSAGLQLSVVIPAHNEEGCIARTVEAIVDRLTIESIPHDVLIVNDHSVDRTEEVLDALHSRFENVRWVRNLRSPGFGLAIQAGLEQFSGDAVCIVMADASDEPDDIVAFYRKLSEGYDCVFGTRFNAKSKIVDYPRYKLALNRIANHFIKMLFALDYDDVTNAFKCFRKEVIVGISPVLSHHFNITVELPLKAIVRGYTYAIVPTNWYNRKSGESKFKVKEMGSRYLFIVLYVFLEKLLSGGDYRRPERVTKAAVR